MGHFRKKIKISFIGWVGPIVSWKPRENEGKREEKRREERRPPCWETVFYGVTATSGEVGCGIGHRRLPAIWRGQRCSRQNSTQNGHCAAVLLSARQ